MIPTPPNWLKPAFPAAHKLPTQNTQSALCPLKEQPLDQFERQCTDDDASASASVSHFRVPPTRVDLHSRLFGPNVKNAYFKQGTIGDCYFLAAVDAMLQHPNGERILRTIKIEEESETDEKGQPARFYKVTVPNQLYQDPIRINARDLEQAEWQGSRPVKGPLGVKLLEQAYGYLIREARNLQREEDEEFPYPNEGFDNIPELMTAGGGLEAFQDLFMGTALVISPEEGAFAADKKKPLAQHPDCREKFEEGMKQIAQDKERDYLFTAEMPDDLSDDEGSADVSDDEDEGVILIHRQSGSGPASDLKFERRHVYSVRAIDPDQRTITVANPHDTEHDVHTLTWDEFCQVFFGLYGIALARPKG